MKPIMETRIIISMMLDYLVNVTDAKNAITPDPPGRPGAGQARPGHSWRVDIWPGL